MGGRGAEDMGPAVETWAGRRYRCRRVTLRIMHRWIDGEEQGGGGGGAGCEGQHSWASEEICNMFDGTARFGKTGYEVHNPSNERREFYELALAVVGTPVRLKINPVDAHGKQYGG